jgi:hypothetical protein
MMIKSILTICAVLALTGCSELDNCADAPTQAKEVGTPPQGDGPSAEPEAGGGAGGADAAEPSEPMPLIYESSTWDDERVAFPAKTCMRFYHGLGTTPEIVNTYVSFRSKESDVTENAGNQGRIKCVDSEQIVIMNDTCEEEFFIRVVAYASGAADTSIECRTGEIGGCAVP